MTLPLIIAAVSLVGLSAAGLTVDARAVKNSATRMFGLSALGIKMLLAFAFLLLALQLPWLPQSRFDQFSHNVTLFTIVAAGVPLVGMALACEYAAVDRLRKDHPLARRRSAAIETEVTALENDE